MKIAFNPSTVAALTSPPNNKDITFDLRGQNIFARGVKFYGTDTNTWRDIKINNVSIGSNILDLRNGSNTTLTNSNGVVTINSTWRPVVDSLTSDSTTSSLSANQGRVLKSLIDGKSDSGHTHDDRYLKLTGGTMLLGEGLRFHSDDNYFGSWEDARIISLLDNNDKICDGGLIIDERATLDGKEYVTELLRIRDSEFKWKGSNILHSGNSYINGSTITLNGSSITVYSSGTADGRYVRKSGDTMSGALNFANNTWNKVGDDVYMGDHNIGGQLCIMGANGTTGLSFHKYGGASIRKSITFDGNTLYMNGSCDYATLSNQTNLLAMNTVPNKTAATSIGSWSPISGRYVFHQKWTDTSTGGDTADFGIYLDGNLTANMVLDGYYNSLLGFRVIGASGGFLKANGTIDNSTYLTSHQSLSNYYTKGEIDNQLGKYKLKSSIWVPETKVICSNFRDFLNKENLHKQAYEELNLYRFFAQGDESNYSSKYNYPVVDSHAMVFSIDGNNGYIRSMNFDLRSNNVYVTSRVANGEWRSWDRLLNTSDIAGLKNDITLHQYLSNTDTTWWPLIWGGSSHSNTSDSTGAVYKSHDVLSWQTSSQTLYATRLRTTFIDLENNRGISRVTTGGTSPYKGIQLPDLQSNGLGMFSKIGEGDGADEGGIIISADTSVIYNSFDTGWGLTIRDKDRGQMDISGNNTIAFGVRQDYRAYSLGGFEKAGSSNSYVLLGGGDHKLESALNVANADTTDGVHINWSGTNDNPTYLASWDDNGKAIRAATRSNITVGNADKVDNRHAISTIPNTGIIYKAAIYTSSSLTSYWVRLANIPSINQNNEFVATIHVQSGHSNPGRSAILLVYLRGAASSLSKSFKICCNSNYDPNRFRLYYKDSDKTSEIWYQTTGQWDGIITTVISQSSEGSLYEGLTLYSGSITAVQTPSMSTYLSAQVSTITDNISGNASTATKLQTARKLWGQSFDGTADVNGTIYINNGNSENGAIILNNNVNTHARISAIWDQVVFNTGSAIRFGGTEWEYSDWAGLKYDTTANTIYLGIADGTVFNYYSSKRSNGIFKLPGIKTITPDSGARIGNTGGDLYLGNSNNSGQVKVQDMCSQSDSDNWIIYQSGNAYFKYIKSKGNAEIVGTLKAGQIIREASSQMWVNGRNGALLRETSVAGYHALWSLKTTDGSWDFGEYNAGSYWNNIPVLTYITDSNYNSGNNTPTYQIRFPLASGTVALTSQASSFDVNTAQYLRSLGNQNCQTGRTQAYGDVYSYNTYNNTGSPTAYTSVIGFGRGIAGTVEIAGGWSNTNLYWRSLRDCCEDWYSWRTVLDSNNYTDFIGSYYWANVKISTTSSTSTSPTVSTLTATSSVKAGNICLEHTNEINNIAGGGVNLNYRNSGNVSLCVGGGNVGIGTMSPDYKLSVNGTTGSNGFHHYAMNSNDYVLLAGGGYGKIFTDKAFTYTDYNHYSLRFHKLSSICNNLVWVDGYVRDTVSEFFYIDASVYPYQYNNDQGMDAIYIMDTNSLIKVSAIGGVLIRGQAGHTYRVGFFYTGRA